MSQPHPRYEPPSPKPRTPGTFTLTELLVVIGILSLLFATIKPIFDKAASEFKRPACLSNGKQLSLAVMMYAQDYDEHLPLAANWYDASYPYCKNKLRCPRLSDPNGIGYAMDERLSGRSLDKVGAPHDESPLLYESRNILANAHDPLNSFVGRHDQQRGWVGFVDGHVKMETEMGTPRSR
jgi:competence protein ComGC